MTKINRRNFLQYASSSALALLAAAAGCKMPRRATLHDATSGNSSKKTSPNILFLLTDDQRWNSLGCMGDPILKTPNIDRLANNGTLFTNCYVTTSICSASRASMLTGQWNCRHKIFSSTNFADQFQPQAWQQTWPAILRRNGYYGGLIGKFGVGGDASKLFDYFNPGGRGCEAVSGTKTFLQNCPKDSPFFLQISYTIPHAVDEDPLQYIYDPKYKNLYQDVTIPTPKTAAEQYWKKLPPFFEDKNEGRVRWAKRFDTPERYQQYVKAYYRLISEIDDSIGQIINELRLAGHDNDTIIVFAGDNGYFLGEHGLADKWYPYEESIRIPLIIYDPRLPANQRGLRIDEITLNVDFAPTFLSLAGTRIPECMQGQDISSFCTGKHPARWRQEFFYEHPTFLDGRIPGSEALVSKDWKYINWINDDYQELFNLRVDPYEENNLASDSAYKEVIQRLDIRLTELRNQCGGKM